MFDRGVGARSGGLWARFRGRCGTPNGSHIMIAYHACWLPARTLFLRAAPSRGT